MRVDLFDFELPPERIALRPAEPREAARILIVDPAHHPEFGDGSVGDLPTFLRAGDLLVVNDTRVIPARLTGQRQRGPATARIDVTLHKREAVDRWRAFVRPAKKLAVGEAVRFGDDAGALVATVLEKSHDGEVLFGFDVAGPALDRAIEAVGRMPLPPYIAGKRAEDDQDRADYQTVFADRPGAVAAPTAGLHFTPGLLEACKKRGIDVVRLTLHVGAGTFLPVKADDTADHRMHAETGEISASAAARIEAARAAGGRVVAVGTTSLRLLESAVGQDGIVRPFSGDTSIFITPGYRFRAVDLLLTNFHLPRSTLFMLVSAFAGLDRMTRAYRHAIAAGYRFYSYGDACLLTRAPSW